MASDTETIMQMLELMRREARGAGLPTAQT